MGRIMRLALLAIPLLLSGCFLYSGTDPEPCEEEYYDRAPPSEEYRDPTSGTCSFLGGGGGGGGGGGTCGDYGGGSGSAEPTREAPGAFIDWAVCYGACEGLDEQTCLGTSACRAAYIDEGGFNSFYECWGTAPSGPIQGGACEGLDAFACSLHDDCSAVHGILEAPGDGDRFINALGAFQNCIAEPGIGIYPGNCIDMVACDEAPPECPQGTVAGRLNGCWTGYCIPLDQCGALPECSTLAEEACVARDDCDGLYQGVNCTCAGESCTCESWDFEGCESAAAP